MPPIREHPEMQVLTDLQRELDSHTVIVEDFNKINKDIHDLYSALDQVDLIDIYRTLHPRSTEYTLFSVPCCTYSKIDHIIGNQTFLSKYKKNRSHNK